MSKIRIKNFGPIKEGFSETLPNGKVNEWLDVKKVTVFIGNQGSGKSTVAKLISTLTWIEKALNRGDLTPKQLTIARFLTLLKYQRINNYYNNGKTEIEYEGDKYFIGFTFNNQFVITRKLEGNPYVPPQIMYVPAERNFLSSVSEAFNVKGMPETLFTFAEELRKAQRKLDGAPIDLPLPGYKYMYDQDKDVSYVIGQDHQVNLLEASSGFQSTIPLFLVTRNLTLILKDKISINDNISIDNLIRMTEEIYKILSDKKLTDKDKQIDLTRNKYVNSCLINIVEEPEQNLFPSSQRQVLNELLGFNNINIDNKLVFTTHSPYLINYLTLCVKAYNVYKFLKDKKINLSDPAYLQISNIVPISSTVNAKDLGIYELDESDGSIIRLPDYKGLPSDENKLNYGLEDSNELFAQLQEIEKGWQ